jgi:hypothetical protein
MSDQDQTTQDAPAAQPELTIVDLQNIRSIIDTASRRGAFNGAELSSVGTVFDRLNTFLNSVAPAQPPVDDSTTETPAA